MSNPSPESRTGSPSSLAKELAALALPPEEPRYLTVSDSMRPRKLKIEDNEPFIRSLKNRSHHGQIFVRTVLEYLGISVDETTRAHIEESAEDLQHLYPRREDQELIGRTVPPDARIRLTISELDQAVSDFYGTTYDGELHYAKALLLHMVEQASQSKAP